MNPDAVLSAVDRIVLDVRRMGFRSGAEVSRGLMREALEYPPGSPIQQELRARAGRFLRSHERKEAAKKASAA